VFPEQCENVESAKRLLLTRQNHQDTFLVLRGTDGAVRRMIHQFLTAEQFQGRIASLPMEHPAHRTYTHPVRGVAVGESGKDRVIVLFDRQGMYKRGDQLPG
jgi:hypothetical protein